MRVPHICDFWFDPLCVRRGTQISPRANDDLRSGDGILIALAVRNLMWSKRFEAGECPFEMKDPGKLLQGFKKVRFVSVLLVSSLVMLFAGIVFLAYRLIFPTSNLLFEVLSVPFFLFSLHLLFHHTPIFCRIPIVCGGTSKLSGLIFQFSLQCAGQARNV